MNLSSDCLKAKMLLSRRFTSRIFIKLPIFFWDCFSKLLYAFP